MLCLNKNFQEESIHLIYDDEIEYNRRFYQTISLPVKLQNIKRQKVERKWPFTSQQERETKIDFCAVLHVIRAVFFIMTIFILQRRSLSRSIHVYIL